MPEVQLHAFLIPVEGEWSESRHGHFTPGEKARGTHCTGERAGAPEAVRALKIKKNVFLYGGAEALDGGEWSVSRPGRFAPRRSAPVSIG
jgi:hypothetical protein